METEHIGVIEHGVVGTKAEIVRNPPLGIPCLLRDLPPWRARHTVPVSSAMTKTTTDNANGRRSDGSIIDLPLKRATEVVEQPELPLPKTAKASSTDALLAGLPVMTRSGIFVVDPVPSLLIGTKSLMTSDWGHSDGWWNVLTSTIGDGSPSRWSGT